MSFFEKMVWREGFEIGVVLHAIERGYLDRTQYRPNALHVINIEKRIRHDGIVKAMDAGPAIRDAAKRKVFPLHVLQQTLHTGIVEDKTVFIDIDDPIDIVLE